MKLEIKSVKVENFKGLKEREFTLSEIAKVSGDNETGKSTLADAIAYCLTGKNSAGETNFGVLPYGASAISPFVELECIIDGKPVTLKREYKAKFNRAKEFTGQYTTETSINGIANTITTFDKYIEENIADNEVFKMLTNAKFFTEQIKGKKGETTSQVQRRMLYEISDIKTDIEIAESQPKFSSLKEHLERFDDISDYKKSLKTSITAINKDINEFIPKTEQQSKNFVEVEFDEKQVLKEKIELEETLQNISKEIEEIKENYNSSISELKLKLKDIQNESQMLELENSSYKKECKAEYEKQQLEKTSDLRSKIAEINASYEREVNAYKVKKSGLENQIQLIENKLGYAVKEKQALLDKYAVEKEKEHSIEDTCPTCKQHLPVESIKAAIKTFEEEKHNKLENIKSKGIPLAEEIKQLEEQKNNLEKQLLEIKEVEAPLELATLKEELGKTNQFANPFVETDKEDYLDKKTELQTMFSEIEGKITATETEMLEKIQARTEEQQKARQEVVGLADKIDIIKRNEAIQKGIDELEEENRSNHSKKDKLESQIMLVDDFLEYKNKMATETVNSKFELVKFKLFDFTKEDGNFKEVCIPTVNGVEYQDLSYSTKIIASLDIVKGFQKHYDKYLPLVVDNAESINLETKLDSQMILLTRTEENCPKCQGQAGRRSEKGLWTCSECGNIWKKTLTVK